MKRLTMLFAMLLLVLGVACSSDDGSSDGAAGSGSGDAAVEAPFEITEEPVATTEVDLPKSYKFDPVAITVDAGEEVTWTNNDDFPHNVHLLDGSDVTEDLPVGGTATLTFDEPGEIYYQCSIHPQQMKGKIVVE
jgi:plastocyanin